jgi:hypothetical protein
MKLELKPMFVIKAWEKNQTDKNIQTLPKNILYIRIFKATSL